MMVLPAVRSGLLALALLWSVPAIAATQEIVPDRKSGSAADPSGAWVRLRESRGAPLRRPVSVRLERVTLAAALEAIAQSANVRVTYGEDVIRSRVRVTLRVDAMPLLDVLTTALEGTNLDAFVSVRGDALLVRPMEPRARANGSLSGRVTDAKTSEPLLGTEVWLDGTKLRAVTGEKGFYRLSGIAPGAYTLVARRVGYAKQNVPVKVVSEQEVTADVALQPVATQLNELVTTVTGEQRAMELGHVVARINVDSLVREAPVTNLPELLQSRVPGLQVVTGNGGVAGGAASLQLRGQTSINLSSDPILIVDGVRYRSTNKVVSPRSFVAVEDIRGPYGAEIRSPLNDLNVNDIELIEVVKGPSASTLYGPDAANGVIVVTTKRPKPGKTQFRWYVRPASNEVVTSHIEQGYTIWSHDPTTGDPAPYNCNLLYQYKYNACILDSITAGQTALNRPDLSVIAKARPAWQFGTSIDGGIPALRYSLGANYSTQVGSVQLPAKAQDYLKHLYGVPSLSDAIVKPNTLSGVDLHANFATDVVKHGTLNLAVTYGQTKQRVADITRIFEGQYIRGSLGQPTHDTLDVRNYVDISTSTVAATEERASRLTAALSGTLTPLPWLTLNASLGFDVGNSIAHSATVLRSPSDINEFNYADDHRRTNIGRTFNVGATAMARAGRVSFRNSIGAQYNYARLDGLSVYGLYLAPGSSSIGTARDKNLGPLWSETASLGGYVEEVVGLNDRLFVTGGLRLDGSTAFGDAYAPHAYPKVGVSWLASDEPFLRDLPVVSELRFRASYGAASRYPTSAMKLGIVDGGSREVAGQNQTIYERQTLANPDLRPERTREAEWGADLTLFSKVNIGLTWYNRRTIDQLQSLQNPTGLPPIWGNVASVRAHGFEATAHATLVDTRSLRADLTFTYSFRNDRVLSLGDAAENRVAYGDGYALGYPLGSVFGRPILGVADTVGGGPDGIAFPEEIIRDPVSRFLGVMYPPRGYVLTPTVALLDGRLRLSSVFDRQTGFVVGDQYAQNCMDIALCLAPFLTSTPLIVQARYFARAQEDFIVPGDFTRWREVTVTVDLPGRLTRVLRMSRATLSLQGRNLALWTDYAGSDPESRSRLGSGWSAGANGIPQARSWSFRFDVAP